MPVAEIPVTPAGTVSVTTAFVAGLGPLLVAVMFQLMGLPAPNDDAEAVFVKTTDEFALTVVVTLQPATLKVAPASALATHVLVMLPVELGALPVTVIVADPTARVGREHDTA